MVNPSPKMPKRQTKPSPFDPRRLKRAERLYYSQLRRIAQQVGEFVGGFPAGDPAHLPALTDMLRRYSEVIRPWAIVTARKMLEEVDQRDAAAWRRAGEELASGIRLELRSSDVGAAMRRLLDDQVTLIQSIPLQAAERVHRLTMQGLEDSTRAKAIAAEIRNTTAVTESRALLIARTEVSRTGANLTEARAQAIGSDAYVWRTSGDADVRHDHKLLANKVFRWVDPPVADQRTGVKANPGCIYNCRCWAEPIPPA